MMIDDSDQIYVGSKMRIVDEDEGLEDILNFKDSDRESLYSFIQSTNTGIEKKQEKPINLIDTPTRLVNESNEFLEIQLAKKRKLNRSNIPQTFIQYRSKSSKDDESSLENTLKAAGTTLSSQERKKKQKIKEDFLKMVSDAPR